MIALPLQIGLALLLDAILGDPRSLPHPVRWIGRFALRLEVTLRAYVANERVAGVLAVVIVFGCTAVLCWLLIAVAQLLHPLLGDALSIVLLYFSFAARDLSRHALEVKQALDAGNLNEARNRVAMLVGRDTAKLDEAELSRATVESVAENTVDAVTAPLFFALLFGPVGAMAYKAINTLDSTFGYKNERYLHFGWAAARLDDLANFVPARLTALLTPCAAALLKLDAGQAWSIFCRDRHKHPSPNGGQIEAAMAGALNVCLGGKNSYFGITSFRPLMGDAKRELCATRIKEVINLMWTVSLLAAAVGLILRFILTGVF
jgi:adenosylcobinamide-phosphate synthase